MKALKHVNIGKVKTALITAIIAWDPLHWLRLDSLFPRENRRLLSSGNRQFAD